MNLSDAQAFVIPRGAHSGRTIQALGAGHLDDVRELLDDEPSDTPFFEALQTFIAWADGQASDDADVPPEPDEQEEVGNVDDDGEDDETYEGPLGE